MEALRLNARSTQNGTRLCDRRNVWTNALIAVWTCGRGVSAVQEFFSNQIFTKCNAVTLFTKIRRKAPTFRSEDISPLAVRAKILKSTGF